MRSAITSYVMAIIGVALVAWITAGLLPVLGLASAVLLFLLPVVFIAARGAIGAALFAAMLSGLAYNYFLLPPRHTFQIHGLDNLISLFVLIVVAAVTSRLAARLHMREADAQMRASRIGEIADLSNVLSEHPSDLGVERGIGFLTRIYGALYLLDDDAALHGVDGFSSLDLSAGAWAMHNRDITGHGTAVIAAADWTFFPIVAPGTRMPALAAVARPASGETRSAEELAHIAQLCRTLGQFRDSQALEAARREQEVLQGRDALRRTLLASLAHDFRTPLTIMSGQLENLAPTSAEAREALNAAKRLNRVMTDLLGIARLEQGALNPRLESIDLVDAVTSACDDRSGHPAADIARHIPPDLPFVLADAVLLHHVLVNLLDNALRHANKLVTWKGWQDGECICLSISDDGDGMSAQQRAQIFDRVHRIEGNDRTGASGLGLAIVKGFADAMNITIEVNVSPEGGACFTLSLPLADGQSA